MDLYQNKQSSVGICAITGKSMQLHNRLIPELKSARISLSNLRPFTNRRPATRRPGPARAISNDMLAGLKKALGQVAGSTMPSTGSPTTGTPFLHFSDTAPSWSDLQDMVTAKQQELGYTAPDLENGPANAAALLRPFGSSAPPKIKLYRDHATWCPYCHKIVLQLEEKRIPYEVEKINMRCYGGKPPEFMAKVPSGLLPVMEINGQIITESAVIQQMLEQMYPETPMLPPEGSTERAKAAELMRLERRLFSDWLQWLCNGWGGDSAKAAFINTMTAIDAALGATEGPYFLTNFSLVDITFAPFLERIAASIAYYKGFIVRGEGRWANIERWFNAMETRDAYVGFRSDYYTHVHDLPPQLGGCVSTPESAATAAAIDGTDNANWHLPLPPLNGTTLPEPYTPGENPQVDRLRAAAKLVGNHEAVVKFALRAVGQVGPRPVSARLCDPTAIPGMEHIAHADGALRYVAHALLAGTEAHGATFKTSVQQGEQGCGLDGKLAVPCLEYARDRVCVPRDLPYPAARQFRAHMNYVIDELKGV